MERTSWQLLTSIARRQRGLISAQQADDKDIPRTSLTAWVQAGRLQRWHRGVYALAGMPDSWERRAMAAVLAAGPGAVLCGRAAARVHGFDVASDALIEVMVPRTRKVSLSGVTVRTTTWLPQEDVTIADGLPVTAVARTIVDIAGPLSPRVVRNVLVESWRRRDVTPGQVAACLAARPCLHGAGKVRAALADCDEQLARARSPAEVDGYLAVVAAGLPACRVNHRVGTRQRPYEVDLAWPEVGYGCEIDGDTYHSLPPDKRDDHEKDMLLAGADWDIDRVAARLVSEDPAAVVKIVREGLRRNGHADVGS